MKEFNSLCKEFETLDVLSYAAILAGKSVKVLPALRAVTDDGLDGVTIFAQYILAAIAADGKLSEEEYILCYPLLFAFFGDDVNYEDCKAAARAAKPFGRELKKTVRMMTDVFSVLSPEIKEDLIVISLMICAVDGKVSLREKRWIKKLMG